MPANDRQATVRHAQRATGQVSALAGLIGAGRPFAEVAQQLLAARGSLDSLLVRLVEVELYERLPAAEARGEVDDLLRMALGRSAPARTNGRGASRRPSPAGVHIGGPTSS